MHGCTVYESKDGEVVHGCTVYESKDGEVVHGCTVNGAKDANPVRQIALYSLDPRLRGDDDKNVIWLQTLK